MIEITTTMIGAFAVGMLLMHLLWLSERWQSLIFGLTQRWWYFKHRHLEKCKGCPDCDEAYGDEQKWNGPRWSIGLSFRPKGDATVEDDVLFAKVGGDPDHSGFCFTHGVRDMGWTFFDDYPRAHKAYHMLRKHMPHISSSWGMSTQFHDGEVGNDWDWTKEPTQVSAQDLIRKP